MARKCILSSMYYVPVEVIPDLAALKKRLTINPIWFNRNEARPRPILQYVLTDDDYVGVPVWFGLENYHHLPLIIRTSKGGELHAPKRPDPNHEKVHNKAAQAKFFADTIKHFETFPAGLAVAGTGTGKTICALNLAAERGRSTLVITDREFLGFEQWIPEAKEKLGLVDAQIGIVQGNICQYDREFVVGMAASIIKNIYPDEFYSAFGTLILDELHKFAAPGMSTILSMFSAEVKLGQTATPKRSDGTQQIFLDYFGPCQIKAEGSALHCQVKVVDYEDEDGRPMPGSHGARMQRLARDDNRSRVLVKEIMEMYNEGRQILVIGDDIKHLQRLEQMCWAKGVPKDRTGQFSRERYIMTNEPGEHHGQKVVIKRQKKARVTNDYLNWCKHHARLIFSTYGMMKEGVDIPRLDGGIDVTPRREAVQVIGRIRRPLPGKRVPKWVTVRDTAHKSLMGYFEERMRDYKSSNVEVIDND